MPDAKKPAVKPAARSAVAAKATTKARAKRTKQEKLYRSIAEIRRDFYPEDEESRSPRDRRDPTSVLGLVSERTEDL